MSLLNDALRKRRAEDRPDGHHTARAALGPAKPRRFKLNRKQAILGGVTIAAVAFAVWCWWWPFGRVSSSFSSGPVQTAALHPGPKEVHAVEPSNDPKPHAQTVQIVEKKTNSRPQAVKPTAAVKSDNDQPAAPAPDKTRPAAPTTAPAETATVKPRYRAAISAATKEVQPPASKPEKTVATIAPAAPPVVPPAQRRQVSATRIYEKARTYHRQGRIPEAIAMYREVLKIDPNHFDTGFNLTSAYLQTRAFNKADAMASDLYRKRPDNPQVALNLAIARIGIGQPREALGLLERISAHSQAPLYEIYFHKGVACRNMGEPAQAVAWYQKAERLKSDDPRLLFNTAVALDQNRQYGPAANYYQKYLKSSEEGDPATRKKVAQRIRTLQAELAATPNKEEKVQ